MTDQFNVTGSFNKLTYNQGDQMVVTISGGDVLTSTTTETATVTVSLLAADGSTSSWVGTVPVTKTGTIPESVLIASVTDSDGRTWLVAANGLSASATA